ncbi:MAG TPA: hypothetical protein VFI11_14000 [Anaerolineales bacterium]|nr:hypothetical protein [Anaerolineales bacterium]
MHGLENAWGDRIRFVYLDIDDPRNDAFKSALGYQYQPHLFLLDGEGKVLRQWVGFVDGSELEAAFLSAAS